MFVGAFVNAVIRMCWYVVCAGDSFRSFCARRDRDGCAALVASADQPERGGGRTKQTNARPTFDVATCAQKASTRNTAHN